MAVQTLHQEWRICHYTIDEEGVTEVQPLHQEWRECQGNAILHQEWRECQGNAITMSGVKRMPGKCNHYVRSEENAREMQSLHQEWRECQGNAITTSGVKRMPGKCNHYVRSEENAREMQSLHQEGRECHVVIQGRRRLGDVTNAPDTQEMPLSNSRRMESCRYIRYVSPLSTFSLM
jgi:hypothetical protein